MDDLYATPAELGNVAYGWIQANPDYDPSLDSNLNAAQRTVVHALYEELHLELGNEELAKYHHARRLGMDNPEIAADMVDSGFGSFMAGASGGAVLVGGRRPRNHRFAGDTFVFDESSSLGRRYPNGVRFNSEGFPDFSPYAIQTVEVPGLTGTRSDLTKANEAAGLARKPRGYTWHHVEDGRTMQLVPTDLHSSVPHTGGAAVIRGGISP